MQKQTQKWLEHFINAFGPQGLIALAWWAGAFHSKRIRELQASYPILQITGGAGVGKSTLVASLWKLAGSFDQGQHISARTCTLAALMTRLSQVVNLPVVIEDGETAEDHFDWKSLRECYDGAIRPRRVSSTGETVNTFTFQGALAVVGGETEVLNRRIVNIHLVRQSKTAAQRQSVQALHDQHDLCHFLYTVRDNREQLVYRLGHVEAYAESLLEETAPGLDQATARNHAQLRALLDLLNDLFTVPSGALHAAHAEVCGMAWVHADSKGERA